MRTFIYQHQNIVYVVEGRTHEEALMQFFKAIPKALQSAFATAPDIEVLPKNLASTSEAREVMHG